MTYTKIIVQNICIKTQKKKNRTMMKSDFSANPYGVLN